jgi:hypothetical protein
MTSQSPNINRWRAFALLGVAFFMTVIDLTIVAADDRPRPASLPDQPAMALAATSSPTAQPKEEEP